MQASTVHSRIFMNAGGPSAYGFAGHRFRGPCGPARPMAHLDLQPLGCLMSPVLLTPKGLTLASPAPLCPDTPVSRLPSSSPAVHSHCARARGWRVHSRLEPSLSLFVQSPCEKHAHLSK